MANSSVTDQAKRDLATFYRDVLGELLTGATKPVLDRMKEVNEATRSEINEVKQEQQKSQTLIRSRFDALAKDIGAEDSEHHRSLMVGLEETTRDLNIVKSAVAGIDANRLARDLTVKVGAAIAAADSPVRQAFDAALTLTNRDIADLKREVGEVGQKVDLIKSRVETAQREAREVVKVEVNAVSTKVTTLEQTNAVRFEDLAKAIACLDERLTQLQAGIGTSPEGSGSTTTLQTRLHRVGEESQHIRGLAAGLREENRRLSFIMIFVGCLSAASLVMQAIR
jgi:hypothetical protein